ncbi:hypothetical protein HB771_17940 [Rhizobium leguminosarum bv. viciae]|nr:hypothetical protein HB771_17940 [Rhizobium leguminosarum bv. viciae]
MPFGSANVAAMVMATGTMRSTTTAIVAGIVNPHLAKCFISKLVACPVLISGAPHLGFECAALPCLAINRPQVRPGYRATY